MLSKRLFVDMDGTLAKFKKVDELEELYEKGYFVKLMPQRNVVNAIREIVLMGRDLDVFILSAFLSDSSYALEEKNEWIEKYLPEIDREHRLFIPCGLDKREFIGNLSREDILLDDYTLNLNSWSVLGKGIKLVNDINDTHKSWDGPRINYLSPSEKIVSEIKIIANEKDYIIKKERQRSY